MKPIRPTAKDQIHYCKTCDNTCGEEQWCEGCAAFICEACDELKIQDLPPDHEPEHHQVRNHPDCDDDLDYLDRFDD